MFYRIVSFIMLFFCCICICACEKVNESDSVLTVAPVKTIKIPDITGVDVSDAKALLTNKGLIPKVEY